MKVVVVGGGLLGLLSARALSQHGVEVTVLEQGDFGQESSWAGGGILSPLYPWNYSPAVNELANWSQKFYPELIQQLIDDGGVDPEWTQSGMLVLDDDPANFVKAKNWARQHDKRWVEWDAKILKEQEIEIGDQYRGLLFPDIAQVRNPRLLKSVLESCKQHGVTLLANRPVTELVHRGGVITGVRSEAADFAAEVVVVCAGAWSAKVMALLQQDVQIRPVRGQMIMYRMPAEQRQPMSRVTLLDDHYVIPRRDGRILVGSTLEEVEFDKSTTEQARMQLSEFAEHLYPSLQNVEIERHWAGLRPASPDGIPYICSVPNYQGLYLNAGHFRNGVVLAPASVQLLMDLIYQRSPLLDPEPYRLQRG